MKSEGVASPARWWMKWSNWWCFRIDLDKTGDERDDPDQMTEWPEKAPQPINSQPTLHALSSFLFDFFFVFFVSTETVKFVKKKKLFKKTCQKPICLKNKQKISWFVVKAKKTFHDFCHQKIVDFQANCWYHLRDQPPLPFGRFKYFNFLII